MILFKYAGPGLIVKHLYNSNGIINKQFLQRHTYLELFVFLAGKGAFHVEGNVYPLNPGDILLFRPNEGHNIELDSGVPYERLAIHFDASLFNVIDPEKQLIRPFFDRKPAMLNRYPKEAFSESCDPYLRCMMEGSDGNRAVILANLILLLTQISKAFAVLPPEDSPLSLEQEVLQYINRSLHRDLNVDILCDKFHISKASLFRLCKKATGTSVSKYIRTKRLLACHMLIEEGEKPTSIFAAYGFQDYSSFYRAYVKQFGYSPSTKAPELMDADHAASEDD